MITLQIQYPEEYDLTRATAVAVASVLKDFRTRGAAPKANLDLPGTQLTASDWPRLLYDHKFESAEELADYEARVKQRDANLGDGGAAQQAALADGAVDVRSYNTQDLKTVCLFMNELVNRSDLIGPTSAMHVLSGFIDFGIQDKGDGTVVPPTGFPQIDWSVEEAKAIKASAWDFTKERTDPGSPRALMSTHRGYTV